MKVGSYPKSWKSPPCGKLDRQRQGPGRQAYSTIPLISQFCSCWWSLRYHWVGDIEDFYGTLKQAVSFYAHGKNIENSILSMSPYQILTPFASSSDPLRSPSRSVGRSGLEKESIKSWIKPFVSDITYNRFSIHCLKCHFAVPNEEG